MVHFPVLVNCNSVISLMHGGYALNSFGLRSTCCNLKAPLQFKGQSSWSHNGSFHYEKWRLAFELRSVKFLYIKFCSWSKGPCHSYLLHTCGIQFDDSITLCVLDIALARQGHSSKLISPRYCLSEGIFLALLSNILHWISAESSHSHKTKEDQRCAGSQQLLSAFDKLKWRVHWLFKSFFTLGRTSWHFFSW